MKRKLLSLTVFYQNLHKIAVNVVQITDNTMYFLLNTEQGFYHFRLINTCVQKLFSTRIL